MIEFIVDCIQTFGMLGLGFLLGWETRSIKAIDDDRKRITRTLQEDIKRCFHELVETKSLDWSNKPK